MDRLDGKVALAFYAPETLEQARRLGHRAERRYDLSPALPFPCSNPADSRLPDPLDFHGSVYG
jgi:hypothetical protein